MRIDLEVLRSEEGVLTGSAAWDGQGPRRAFHGTLELIAILEAAATSPPPVIPGPTTTIGEVSDG